MTRKLAPTEKQLLDIYNSARGGAIKTFVDRQMKKNGRHHPIAHFYVMSRLSFRDGHYANALMFYSMGLPDIEKVTPVTKKRALFRRYNIDIRTELEQLLASI